MSRIARGMGWILIGVVTALTVQDSGRVHQVLPVFPTVVLDQIRVLVADVPPHAIKLGMLASDDVVRNVEQGLLALGPRALPPLVIDPVLEASDGTPLLERRAVPSLERLIGLSTLVTPSGARASTTALTMVCADPIVPASPIPLTPIGFTSVGVVVRDNSNDGKSPAVGIG